jgi:hypothetical protein
MCWIKQTNQKETDYPDKINGGTLGWVGRITSYQKEISDDYDSEILLLTSDKEKCFAITTNWIEEKDIEKVCKMIKKRLRKALRDNKENI